MSTVGEQLREAREAQNLTIHQVAEVTKIRTDHLRALEEGNYDVFSAPVYILGFVRNYAALVKLDTAQIMAELDAELSGTEKFAEPPPLSDHPRGFVDWLMLQLSKFDLRKSLVVVGVVVVVLFILLINSIWRHYRSADPLSGLKPGMYHPTQSISGETLPLPTPS